MSLKIPKKLLIIGAVVAALLAGTILLGNYANILPAGSDTGSQAEASQATDQTSCSAAKACPLGSDAKACCSKEADGSCPKKAESSCTVKAESSCTVKTESSCTVKAESSCTE